MRRVLTVLAAAAVFGGAGCRHCCGDRPRLFDDTRRREPDCDKPDCPPSARGASAPRLGSPVPGRGVGLAMSPPAYSVLPTYSPPTMVVPSPGLTPADLLPAPTPGNIPSIEVPLSPPMPAVPGAALLPPPSTRPAGR